VHGRDVETIVEVFVLVCESQSTESLTVLTGKTETEITVYVLFSDVVVKQAMPIGHMMPLAKVGGSRCF
jgi:hypothetical protein